MSKFKITSQLSQVSWRKSKLSAIPISSWILLLIMLWFIFWSLQLFLVQTDQFKVGIIAFVGSAFAAIYAQTKSKQRENDSRLFQQKATAYKKMFDLVGNLFNKKEGAAEVDLVFELKDFQKDLLIWGSEKTIKAYNLMMARITATSSDPVETALQINNLFSEMRKDLGHRDKHLSHFDLIGIFLKPEDKEAFFNRQFNTTETGK